MIRIFLVFIMLVVFVALAEIIEHYEPKWLIYYIESCLFVGFVLFVLANRVRMQYWKGMTKLMWLPFLAVVFYAASIYCNLPGFRFVAPSLALLWIGWLAYLYLSRDGERE